MATLKKKQVIKEGEMSFDKTGINKYNPNTGQFLAKGESVTIKRPKSSTVLSNTNKIDQVGTMNKKVEELSKKGVVTDNQGNQRYSDGSFVNVPEYGSVNEDGSVNQFNPNTGKSTKPKETTQQSNLQQEVEADTSEEDNYSQKLLSQMKKSVDATTKLQLDNIEQKFALRKQQQQEINRRAEAGTNNALLMGGVTGQGSSAQYAPISSGGIVQAQESYGLQQLAALDSEEQDLIASVRQAQSAGNYQIMERELERVEKVRDEKIKKAADLNKQIAETNKKLAEEQLQVEKETAIADVYASGVSDTAEAMKVLRSKGVNATTKEVADTMSLLSGVGGSGIVGEYNFYRSEARKAGQVPVDFNTYQNMDANRKISIARAGATSGSSLAGGGTRATTFSEKQIKQIDSSPEAKKLSALTDLKGKLDAYKNVAAQEGKFDLTGTRKSIADSLYADLKIAYKEAANLGALTGPDVAIIQEAIKPTSGGFGKLVGYKAGGGQAGVLASIDTALATLERQRSQNAARLTSKWGDSDPYIQTLIGEGANSVQSPANNLIQQESDAEITVTNYVKSNKKVKKQVQDMLKDNVPYMTIKQTLGI